MKLKKLKLSLKIKLDCKIIINLLMKINKKFN